MMAPEAIIRYMVDLANQWESKAQKIYMQHMSSEDMTPGYPDGIRETLTTCAGNLRSLIKFVRNQ